VGDKAAPTLAEILTLTELGPGLYDADLCHEGYRTLFGSGPAMYGGQLLGQGVAAAVARAPTGWRPHQLTGYFLRPGRPDRPTRYTVRTLREGRAFGLRRVDAHQDDRLLFTMHVSAYASTRAPGVQDVTAVPAPAPDDLPPWSPGHLFGIEARLPPQPTEGPWPTRYWIRAAPSPPDLPGVDACLLAYASDTSTPLFPGTGGHHGPTVTHSLWFHRAFDPGGWLLVDLQRRAVADGLGFYLGAVFDAGGQLVATLAQEATFRPVE
jgi:acyl-CoA thioesterase II